MQFKRRFFSIAYLLVPLCLLLGITSAQGLPPERSTGEKHVRLLTVGNSFSRNATRYLSDLVNSGGHRLTHNSIVVGGASLQLHAEKAAARVTRSNEVIARRLALAEAE